MLTTERTHRQVQRTGTGQARGAFQAEIERQGLDARPLPEVRIDRVPVPADAAGIQPGELALARSRRQFANDVPVQLATSYYPLDIAGDTQIEQEDPGPGEAIPASPTSGSSRSHSGRFSRCGCQMRMNRGYCAWTPNSA